MTMVGFPLLLIPLAIYNILVFLMPGVSLSEPLFRVTLVSGSDWPVTLSDILLALGVLLLLLEVIKGARPGAKYLTDHLLSFVIFGAAAAEFLLWPKFASSTYFLLTLLALADFASGIALRARRGTQVAPAVAVSGRATKKADVPADTKADIRPAEPHFEPEPAPSPPPAPSAPPASAASVAESVRLDHPEPKMAQPAVVESEPTAQPAVVPSEPEPVVASREPEPKVASPELQPSDGAPASPEAPQR